MTLSFVLNVLTLLTGCGLFVTTDVVFQCLKAAYTHVFCFVVGSIDTLHSELYFAIRQHVNTLAQIRSVR